MSKGKKSRTADNSDSEKTIADLKRAVEELVSQRKKPEELEGIMDEAETLALPERESRASWRSH